MDYQKQAQDFCAKYNVKIEVVFQYHGKHFDDDEHERDVYRVTISRPNRKPWSFNFVQSINESSLPESKYSDGQVIRIKSPYSRAVTGSKLVELRRGTKPDEYDILACLTKHEVGSHADFCSDFGYDEDSRKVLELYLRVQDEWSNVQRMFGDCLEEVQEIQ